MAVSFLTNLTEQEFKVFLREAILEILGQGVVGEKSDEPLSIEQAAKFLKLTVGTLYIKVHRKEVPHSKRGNRLYFSLSELSEYIKRGKVKSSEQLNAEAANHLHLKHKRR